MPDTLITSTRDANPDTERFDAIIVGAGISGMYQLYRLRELGLRVRVFETGGDVGGTWYWNRYPGARFDSESWSYGFSFSEELLQDWNWTEHFSPQPDTLRYLNHVADRFDLRRDMQFNSRVAAAHWQEDTREWIVTLDGGEQYRGRFLFTALGPLSAYTMPNIPGTETYGGEAHHTARWPHHPVDFNGRHVGVIGTGASAIQTLPEIVDKVASLTVFQRTPNWAAPLHNSKITAAEHEAIRARYPEIFARCRETVSCFIHTPDPRRTFDVSEEEREAFWEKLYAEPGFGIWMANFRDMLTDQDANDAISAFVARKIRQRVKDPAVAEKLIPKNHGFGTRRVPLESGYYEVFNRDHVTLVDINETPIERITPKGVKTTDREYEFDLLIYATGFDGVTGAYDRIDIRGPNGLRLADAWAEGPRTFLGLQPEGFPNLFMLMGPHTARGNIPRSIEQSVEWLTALVRFLSDNGYTRIEPRAEPVAEWTRHVIDAARILLSYNVDSWMTGVNKNVEGRTVRRVVGYNGSAVRYRKRADAVAAGGYREFLVS
ncbi:MAG TPA: NAD(P)/FAD-dependent oxidoreductase [Rhodopila sp.]|uniref:flavin-containing monooxygenase n=1 Tax=Rhodopila sp. TaxID=2480087 RepID=UPI002D03F68E|nr:NAD(P)/FAD-dependent oxidoreductase [Rhodopila sp.]HVY18016.1 NAD(P)/FAD-dependent oxidoreductase [Rhodopila sp.]